MLIPYADEIFNDHQRGYRRNRSTIVQVSYMRQILEKKWEYNWYSKAAIYGFQESLFFT
jgi:hypothetical protein